MWIILLLFLLLFFFLPQIIKWYTRYRLNEIQRKFMRRMGLDPDGDAQRGRGFGDSWRRRGNASRDNSREDSRRGADDSARQRRPNPDEEKIIPRDYGEDVEYTEVREHSESVNVSESTDGTHRRVKVEAQMTDAEWEEVKE